MTPLHVLLVSLSLVAFAGNSLLTRAAVGGGALDAAPFALVRVVTGALALVGIGSLWQRRETRRPSWMAAWTLAGYLVAFTTAYTRIGAAIGALLLFGSVQVTMVGAGLLTGERPRRLDWVGCALATLGLLLLTLPGATAPDAAGAVLMIAAGSCWGIYSLIGRGGASPLSETAVNFVRTSALVCVPLAWASWPPSGTPTGVALATASGVLGSGLGYTLWYMVLPHLAAWRAAILQLVVPVLTAAGAAALLDEAIPARLVIAGAFIGLGVWVTTHKA